MTFFYMAKYNNNAAMNPLPWNSYKDLPISWRYFGSLLLRHLKKQHQETAMQLAQLSFQLNQLNQKSSSPPP